MQPHGQIANETDVIAYQGLTEQIENSIVDND